MDLRFRNFPSFIFLKLKVAHGSRSRRRRTTTTRRRRRRRRRAAADRVELPGLELERGELVVVLVGERGVEVRIVRRRAAVDRHEVGEVAPPGQARDSGLSPVPRLCGRGEVRFTTDSQVREIRDLTR